MKRIICAVLFIVLLLSLTACGKMPELNAEFNDQTGGVDVTADRVRNGYAIGHIFLEEGECLVVSPLLDKGYFLLDVSPAQTPEEPALHLRVEGRAMSSYALDPGEYELRLSVEKTTTGTLSIMPYNAAELAAQDAALSEILEGGGADAEGLDLTGALPEIPELGNDDYYDVATSVGRALVEITAYNVRQFCLDNDMESLSEVIRYPIDINGRQIADAAEFVQYTAEHPFEESFLKSIEAETCRDMFANSQGISMADGYIWLGQVEENGVHVIKIISFSAFQE